MEHTSLFIAEVFFVVSEHVCRILEMI